MRVVSFEAGEQAGLGAMVVRSGVTPVLPVRGLHVGKEKVTETRRVLTGNDQARVEMFMGH